MTLVSSHSTVPLPDHKQGSAPEKGTIVRSFWWRHSWAFPPLQTQLLFSIPSEEPAYATLWWQTQHNTCRRGCHQREDTGRTTAAVTDRRLTIPFHQWAPHTNFSFTFTERYNVRTVIFSLKLSFMGNLMQLPANHELLSQLQAWSQSAWDRPPEPALSNVSQCHSFSV